MSAEKAETGDLADWNTGFTRSIINVPPQLQYPLYSLPPEVLSA